jgi:hypothetical protein
VSASADAVPIAALTNAPAASISNGLISAKLYLPDVHRGFYRGTRFDWAGVIGSLSYRGHDYYVPWFRAVDPAVRDFVFENGAVTASPNTAASGPVEEFNDEGGALGYAQVPPGGVFLKIGVGALRRADASDYSSFGHYPIVDPGRRTTSIGPEQIVFTHALADRGSGYAYRYTKIVRLVPDQPVMLIEHELHNSGSRPIASSVYDHNFLNLDGTGTNAGLALSTPFTLTAVQPPSPRFAEVAGRRFTYRISLVPDQTVATGFTGFGPGAADYDFHIVDPSRGAGLRISADQPMARVQLWSIRPVMAIEPFLTIKIAPGQSFRWTYRYEFEVPPKNDASPSGNAP